MHSKRFRLTALGGLALLLALSTAASAGVVTGGIDLWRTPGDGSTYADFSANPIPAGFFCPQSPAFSGKIFFEGVPVATEPPGVLGRTDTIVQRLDDARFNGRGVAVTRVQVRALSLASVAPVETACGLYSAVVTLSGEQPITEMRIFRDKAGSGHFSAPLAINARVTFTPVAGRADSRLGLTQEIRFRSNPDLVWAASGGKGRLEHSGFVRVDTDGDREADTFLPGTSNFAAGLAAGPGTESVAPSCHCDPTLSFSSSPGAATAIACSHLHCPVPVLE